jgi:LPXTG-motif cell wall-anchored protein
VVSGPAPSEPGVEVLTQQVTRGQLPTTGVETWKLAALGAGLLAVGASMVRRAGKLTHGDDAS